MYGICGHDVYSKDAIVMSILCSTSSYMNTGMELTRYPVYYQMSNGTSNSVYKLQHIPCRPFSRRVMKCSVWVVKLLEHLAKHVHSPPTSPHTSVWEPCLRLCHWPLQLTLQSLPRKTSYTVYIVNKWKSTGEKVLYLRATDSHVDLLNAATSCFRAKNQNLTKATFFFCLSSSTLLYSAFSLVEGLVWK